MFMYICNKKCETLVKMIKANIIILRNQLSPPHIREDKSSINKIQSFIYGKKVKTVFFNKN